MENLGYLERLFQNRLLCPTPTNPVLLQTVERKLKIRWRFLMSENKEKQEEKIESKNEVETVNPTRFLKYAREATRQYKDALDRLKNS